MLTPKFPDRISSSPVGRKHSIKIASQLQPSEVLQRLRSLGQELKESSLPDDLRMLGISGLQVSIEGNRYSIKWLGSISPLYNPACVGTVDITDDGSRISAWFRLRVKEIMLLACLIAIPFALLVSGASIVVWIGFGATTAVLAALISRQRGAGVLRTRLLEVLRVVAQAGPTPVLKHRR